MLFKKNHTPIETPELGIEEARAIYSKLSQGKSISDLFHENHLIPHSQAVLVEAQRIEIEMISRMQGSYELSPEVTDPETYEIVEAAVYYEVTTEAALNASISSELLIVSSVVGDVRKWSDGSPDLAPTWEDYKASFDNGNEG